MSVSLKCRRPWLREITGLKTNNGKATDLDHKFVRLYEAEDGRFKPYGDLHDGIYDATSDDKRLWFFINGDRIREEVSPFCFRYGIDDWRTDHNFEAEQFDDDLLEEGPRLCCKLVLADNDRAWRHLLEVLESKQKSVGVRDQRIRIVDTIDDI
jgi:hypothetical protein